MEWRDIGGWYVRLDGEWLGTKAETGRHCVRFEQLWVEEVLFICSLLQNWRMMVAIGFD